jgi:hypothetical protein
VTGQDLGKVLAPYRMQRKRLGGQGWHVLTLPAGTRAADMRRRLHQHPWFQHVEEDRLHLLSQVYNDTFFSSLWHLERLSATPAWATATGMGRGVTVAVVDTGVQADHPDLLGALLPGWNVVDGTPQAADTHGHGTSVAGLLAARVVNVSFDGVMGSMVICSAAQALFRQGGLILVVAAGTRGQQDVYTAQPGRTVMGALDERDMRPTWATYGEHLALAVPGDGLWTTGLGEGYRVVWGTSSQSTSTSVTTTPPPTQMLGTTGSSGNAWLGLDVDTTLAPLVSSVQLSIGSQTWLVDPSPPFAFTLNLQDQPRGLLRVRLQGLNVQGAVIAQADIEVSNTLSNLIVSGVRLMPLASSDVATPTTANTPTNRTGTGWSALRRTDAGRMRR